MSVSTTTTKRTSGRRSSRDLAKGAAAAAAASASPAKTSSRGKRSAEELKAIAAAQAACMEIEVAASEMRLKGDLPTTFSTTSYAHALRSKTRDGWRIFIYHQGQKLTFNGEVRASQSGLLLFGFKPTPNKGHVFIEEREVSVVELAHTELEAVIEGFRAWFISAFGNSPEELLATAAKGLSHADYNAANALEGEEEASVALEQFIPSWGRWA
jgi:hypothetical protein